MYQYDGVRLRACVWQHPGLGSCGALVQGSLTPSGGKTCVNQDTESDLWPRNSWPQTLHHQGIGNVLSCMIARGPILATMFSADTSGHRAGCYHRTGEL